MRLAVEEVLLEWSNYYINPIKNIMTKEEARQILHSMTKGESLLRHARTVELVMEAYAEHFEQDVNLWGYAGLLHDADYEAYPDKHPSVIVNKLRELGEEELAYAISAHYTKWGNPQVSLLDKCLLASDELTGFIVACCQVRPDGITSLTPKSVTKKLKQKSFAASVDRQEISIGADQMNFQLNEHIQFIIDVLKENREELNL